MLTLRWLAPLAAVLCATGCTRMSTREATIPATERAFGSVPGADARSRTVFFDRAEFLTGAAARRAAEADRAVEPGEPVPNDYYIRDPRMSVEELVVDPSARIRGATPVTHLARRPPCQPCPYFNVTVDQFFAAWETTGRGDQGKYWLTIRNGRVVAIDEQYVP